jgi:hypothetical protein
MANRNRCNNFNIQEYQKNELYKQGTNDIPYAFNSPPTNENRTNANNIIIPPLTGPVAVGNKDWTMHFDTRHTSGITNYANGEITFNISDLNSGRDIGNIVEITLGSFYFPKPVQDANSPDFYFYQKVYLNIQGLPLSQSARAANGKTFNFELDVTNNNAIAVLLTPIRPFYLQTVLNSLNEIKMQFSVGPDFTPIPLLPTSCIIIGVAGTNPAQFTIIGTDDTSIFGLTGGYPQTPTAPGIAIYITGYSGVPAINNPQGLFVTSITDANNFIVGSLSLVGVPALTATMVVGKNRICVPMRFTTIENNVTNYTSITKS